jgi:pimeloyl-ACP methyl ester carboxylesterase
MCEGNLQAYPVNFRELGIESETDLGRAGWRNVDWRALRAFRFTMRGFDVRDRLRDIAAPTIVLHGTEDSLFAVEDAQLLAREMPAAELRLINGADHALPITHAGDVKRAVNDLLAG